MRSLVRREDGEEQEGMDGSCMQSSSRVAKQESGKN